MTFSSTGLLLLPSTTLRITSASLTWLFHHMRIVIEKHLRSEICRALISYFFKISKEINVLNHFTSSDKCLGDERDNILHLKGGGKTKKQTCLDYYSNRSTNSTLCKCLHRMIMNTSRCYNHLVQWKQYTNV